jgi:Putative beta-lactamase-inhibitor-like, PepSY-like
MVFAIILQFATTLSAQKTAEKDVPAAVKNSFKKQYPAATNLKWDKEGDKYEASYTLNKVVSSVLYDAQGKSVESEVKIKTTDLPVGIAEYVKANYPTKKLKGAAKITAADGTVTYEAEIKGLDLIFDKDGIFIKAVKD